MFGRRNEGDDTGMVESKTTAVSETVLAECDQCGASVETGKLAKHIAWHDDVVRSKPEIVYRYDGGGTAAYENTPDGGLRARPDLSTPPAGYKEWLSAPVVFNIPPVEQAPRPQHIRRRGRR